MTPSSTLRAPHAAPPADGAPDAGAADVDTVLAAFGRQRAAVDAALMPLHRASWKLKIALDRWPQLTWRVARTQLLWRSVEKLLLGELGAPGEQRGLARVPLRALDALGKRSHSFDPAA